ncbi:MAG: N-acetylmuramoyl-L-alanine amidase, partial [Elainella sp.]
PIPPSPHSPTSLIQPLLDRHLLPASPEGFQPQAALTAADWQSWLDWANLGGAGAESELESESDAASDQPLTRLQVILSLVQALDLPQAHPALLRPYRDCSQIPSRATVAVATALRHGLMLSPQPDRLFPLQDASRGEAAAMLYQALALKQQVATVELPQLLREPPPLTMPPRRSRPPVVVLDPGHGGSDSGVATEAEVEENAPAAPDPQFDQNKLVMSPLPAGSLNEFADLAEFGLSAQSPLVAPQSQIQSQNQARTQAQPQMPFQPEPPPGMPIEPDRDPEAPQELPSLEEKTVNLAVAEAVANFLRQQGIQVVLTRSGDETRSLAERVAVAAEQQADLFVSLHANASLTQQTSLNGVETYHNPSSTESRRLAWAIHKSLTRSSDVVDRGVHEATFLPLRQPWPAVHLEVGYITGSQDAPSLANMAYHRFLGRSIANGILRYVRQAQG